MKGIFIILCFRSVLHEGSLKRREPGFPARSGPFFTGTLRGGLPCLGRKAIGDCSPAVAGLFRTCRREEAAAAVDVGGKMRVSARAVTGASTPRVQARKRPVAKVRKARKRVYQVRLREGEEGAGFRAYLGLCTSPQDSLQAISAARGFAQGELASRSREPGGTKIDRLRAVALAAIGASGRRVRTRGTDGRIDKEDSPLGRRFFRAQGCAPYHANAYALEYSYPFQANDGPTGAKWHAMPEAR
jgi:hypothetical protein